MNGKGQLGLGDTAERLAPTQVSGVSGCVGLQAGVYRFFARTAAGDVWAWGDNETGLLGLGDTSPHPTPAKLPMSAQFLQAVRRTTRRSAPGRTRSSTAGAPTPRGSWGSPVEARSRPRARGFALDVTGPVTQALKNAKARRGSSVKLSYRLSDEYCRTCSAVRLIVKKAGGGQAAAFSLGDRPTGRTLTKTFVCKLKPGTYTWSLTAVDSAGNAQRSAVARRLVVVR